MTDYKPGQRELLAEFEGWKYTQRPHYGDPQDGEGLLGYVTDWLNPRNKQVVSGSYYHAEDVIEPPPVDYLHNDTDCMALIEALNDAGYRVDVDFLPTGDCAVYMYGQNQGTPKHYGDWKRGVVTLATPIAEAAKYQPAVRVGANATGANP